MIARPFLFLIAAMSCFRPHSAIRAIMPFAFLAVFVLVSSVHAATQQIPITSVLLYPGGASVERSTQITPGTTTVEFQGLPATFLGETLRAHADNGIRIVQIITQEINQPQTVMAREAELQQQIQELKDRLALIEVDSKSAGLVRSYLEHLSGGSVHSAAVDKPIPYLDAKSMAAVLDSLRNQGRDALERIQKSEIRKRTLTQQIDSLQRDLDKIRTGVRATRTIQVKVAARQPGMLHLSYQVNGAGWKPSYRATLDSNASTMKLERLATLAQITGEDWKDVQLTLSTVQPRPSVQAPEPQPWLLRFYKPAPRSEPGVARAYKAAPSPNLATARHGHDEADVALPILEHHSEFHTEYIVPGRVSLASDGREISVSLSQQILTARQRVRIAPRLDVRGTLIAETARPEGVWIAGNLQLFRDGSYLGATQWNPQADEKFVIPFGHDELIRATVERTQEQSGSGGFMDTRRIRKAGYTYHIQSAHRSPIDILLLESTPVSTAQEIKVEANLMPKADIDNWQGRQGVSAWEFKLGPGQKASFSAEYAITYPQEGNVSNLP